MSLSQIIKGYSRLATDKLSLTQETELTKSRIKTCLNCDYLDRSVIGTFICKDCGCPVEALVRGKKCPLNKW